MQGQHMTVQHGQHVGMPQHGPPHVLSHFAVWSCCPLLLLRRARLPEKRPKLASAHYHTLPNALPNAASMSRVRSQRPRARAFQRMRRIFSMQRCGQVTPARRATAACRLIKPAARLLCASSTTRQQSPAPGATHYVMSPGQYASPMMVHGVAAASPIVDCWGLPTWFPFGAAPQVHPAALRVAPPHPALVAYDHIIKVLCLTPICYACGDMRYTAT